MKETGVIYVGHLPHGFFEKEIKAFFSQFGKVKNVRVCRSKHSGRSKGYGFIEFELKEVAEIAAETMHNYIMFKKRLEVRYVPNKDRKKLFKYTDIWNPKKYPMVKRRNQANTIKNTNVKRSAQRERQLEGVKKLNKKMTILKNLGITYKLKISGKVNAPAKKRKITE